MHPGIGGPLQKAVKIIRSQDQVTGDFCLVARPHDLEFDLSRENGIGGRRRRRFLRLFSHLQLLPPENSASAVWS